VDIGGVVRAQPYAGPARPANDQARRFVSGYNEDSKAKRCRLRLQRFVLRPFPFNGSPSGHRQRPTEITSGNASIEQRRPR
jgi:hypothetical protein